MAGGRALRFDGPAQVELEVAFSVRDLRDYLTTQSNVEAALRAGEGLEELDAWLDAELMRFFDGGPRRFAYRGRAETARRVS